ncbi:MAG: hypothetical protein ACR2O6_05630 [Ilumatobacteraceae bacterium]
MTGFVDGRHPEAAAEEWLFAAWTADASLGLVSGHRIVGRTAWYWAALARHGRPLLHVADFDVPVRADPFIVKGEALWAEHMCDAPMEQWSIGNETYAAALDDPDEALGRAYGIPTPIAFDVEWYATGDATTIEFGYEQPGVAHGAIEILGEPSLELEEVPAHRWHRWSDNTLRPVDLDAVAAHPGVRAPFVFPDGATTDWVVTSDGWRSRHTPPG